MTISPRTSEQSMTGDWPALKVSEWTPTRETLHMWLQIIGKIRLAKAPMVNHWWQVPFYVTPRGLTTSTIPDGTRSLEIEFDFASHELHIDVDDGGRGALALQPKSVADFYSETLSVLADLGIDVTINASPNEVEVAVPFDEDHEHTSYVPEHAQQFWRQLLQVNRVIHDFRSRFSGKVSPVHVFWGGLDLACTRFSGRRAPLHPGGAPNVGNWVMQEGYSHELSSCGFWPGGSDEGSFYSYAYPEPRGYADYPIGPDSAFYSAEAGEFLLPYEAVRTSADPDETLLRFLQTTYEAAANLGSWDRQMLEIDPDRWAGKGEIPSIARPRE